MDRSAPNWTVAQIQKPSTLEGISVKTGALWHQLDKWGMTLQKNAVRRRARAQRYAARQAGSLKTNAENSIARTELRLLLMRMRPPRSATVHKAIRSSLIGVRSVEEIQAWAENSVHAPSFLSKRNLIFSLFKPRVQIGPKHREPTFQRRFVGRDSLFISCRRLVPAIRSSRLGVVLLQSVGRGLLTTSSTPSRIS